MTYKHILFVFLTLCGGVLYHFGAEWVLGITPIYIVASLVFLLKKQQFSKKHSTILIAAGVIGYFSEIIGVHTGLLYGSYAYGNTLGPKLLGVAILLFVMWVFVPISMYSVIPHNTKWLPFIAGAGAVMYDIPLEHFATRFGLWSWQGSIPVSNFLTWFIVTSLIVFMFRKYSLPKSNTMDALVVLCTHIVFFITLILL